MQSLKLTGHSLSAICPHSSGPDTEINQQDYKAHLPNFTPVQEVLWGQVPPPPAPEKMVRRTEGRECNEMAELLPDHWGAQE